MSETYTIPSRIPQRMISRLRAIHVAAIANRRAMTHTDLMTILFTQGHGRKSLALITSLRAS